jgi:hypothetical protein
MPRHQGPKGLERCSIQVGQSSTGLAFTLAKQGMSISKDQGKMRIARDKGITHPPRQASRQNSAPAPDEIG